MCAPIPHDPSTNEISALSKTGFSGSGKVHTGKSAVLWALPNSMLPLGGFTLFAYCHSLDLSSHPNSVPGSDGQPKRRDIRVVGISREYCSYLGLLGAVEGLWSASCPNPNTSIQS